MKNEIQLPIINDTVLQSMYCIIELAVSYTHRPVYIACKTKPDYERVLDKVMTDYRNDNYILAACEHKYTFYNTPVFCHTYTQLGNPIMLEGYDSVTQIILTL